MFEQDEEKTFKEIYRESLSRELSRPEVEEGKKKFLASFYAPPVRPAFSFLSFGFLIPAISVLGIFLFFGRIQTHSVPVEGPGAPINLMFGSVMEEAKAKKAEAEAKAKAEAELKTKQAAGLAAEDPLRNHMQPRVVVRRIASRVGPTMVYQKAYREAPVTVIWVFTGGGQH